jgi:tetratricopeptide (TPR) repeat protein
MAVIDGDFTAAHAFLEESLAINRELGRPALQASALNFLGEEAYFGGDYAKARSLCEQSLSLFREVGEKTGIAEALLRLGRAVCRQVDRQSARAA